MGPYIKPAKSPADLVQQLKQRGLVISDEARAERYIDNIGYYRLSAYMYPFLSEPKAAHQYKPGVTFDRVLRLYRFDKKLRVLLFNEIEKIEVAFRAAVVNTITDRTGDIFWMTNPAYVNSGTLSLIQREYAHSTDKRRTYYNICIIKYFLDIISPKNDFKDKLLALFAAFPEIDLSAMGFNANWETEPLWL